MNKKHEIKMWNDKNRPINKIFRTISHVESTKGKLIWVLNVVNMTSWTSKSYSTVKNIRNVGKKQRDCRKD